MMTTLAQRRAAALLRRHHTPAQRATWKTGTPSFYHPYIDVRAPLSGRRYRIYASRFAPIVGVLQLDSAGNLVRSLCIHVRRDSDGLVLPREDQVLAFMLLVRCNENALRSVANTYTIWPPR